MHAPRGLNGPRKGFNRLSGISLTAIKIANFPGFPDKRSQAFAVSAADDQGEL